jgi:hypothetical protein
MGKATLIMVIGLSIVLGMVGMNLGSRSTSAITNAENYYMDAALFSMKTSGANIAVETVFMDPTYVDAITVGSTTSVYAGSVQMKIRGSGDYKKVGDLSVIIGRPVRDSVFVQSISVGEMYSARGILETHRDTTLVGMRRTNFAEYAYFTDYEKTPSGSTIWWISGDSIGINETDTTNGGKVHTNDMIHIDGSPVFFGKVTTGKGMEKKTGANPIFKGGYESGVTIEMPGDFSLIEANKYGGFERHNGADIWLTFYPGSGGPGSYGTMGYKYSATGIDSALVDLTLSSSFNGLVVITGANVHIKGHLNGYVTVAALQGSGTTSKGNIWIDDDVEYFVDPRFTNNPLYDDDYLGLVADNNVWVTDNTANNTGGCDIQAAIMARKGSFGAQNYSTRAVAGSLRLLGGIIQETRGAVGTFSGSTITHGYRKHYSYDGRMATKYPPFFPMTKQFKIYSWWE